MATYSRKNLVLGKQGPFSVTFPKTTNAPVIVWDASNGSFVNPNAVDNDIVDAANLGAGLPVFENQVGDELQFNTISSQGNTTVTQVGNEIVIASGMYIVPDITARDALVPTLSLGPPGVQVFVQDTGQGEYSVFMWDGSSFVLISTQDSANTDSKTSQIDVDYTMLTTPIVSVSPNSRVSNIIIEVLNLFDDPAAKISIGDDTNGNGIHVPDNLVDLNIFDSFETSSTFIYPAPNEETIKAYLSPAGSTTGLLRITLTYV